MMKRFCAVLAAALSLFVARPVAADYTFSAGGQTITQGATVVGGKSRSHVILYDSAGNPVLTSGNPGYFSLAGPIPAGTNGIGSVTISNFPATQPISGNVGVTALPALPAGTNTIGSIANITGTVPLPTGAATAANQATANTSLATVASNTAGLATAAGQSTANFSLGSIDAKTPALANGRVPVDGSAVTQPTETVIRSTSVDRGAVLTTAGAAQTLVPANAARRGLAIQNRAAPSSAYSATTSVFMSCQATATQDFHSLEIPAGALYETPSHHTGTGACSFVSGTASTPVYVREF